MWCLCLQFLTHWGRVTHICVLNLTIIGPDNGLSPGRRQAIIWTNAGILLIGPLGTNFSEILIGIQTLSFKKMHLKMSSAKWRPCCLGLNVLTSVCLLPHTWPSLALLWLLCSCREILLGLYLSSVNNMHTSLRKTYHHIMKDFIHPTQIWIKLTQNCNNMDKHVILICLCQFIHGNINNHGFFSTIRRTWYVILKVLFVNILITWLSYCHLILCVLNCP